MSLANRRQNKKKTHRIPDRSPGGTEEGAVVQHHWKRFWSPRLAPLRTTILSSLTQMPRLETFSAEYVPVDILDDDRQTEEGNLCVWFRARTILLRSSTYTHATTLDLIPRSDCRKWLECQPWLLLLLDVGRNRRRWEWEQTARHANHNHALRIPNGVVDVCAERALLPPSGWGRDANARRQDQNAHQEMKFVCSGWWESFF